MLQIHPAVPNLTILDVYSQLFAKAADHKLGLGVGEVDHETLAPRAPAPARPRISQVKKRVIISIAHEIQ